MTAALDPFHDGRLDPRGVPDHRTTPSICQEIRHSFDLSPPPGAVDGWCAVLFSTPLDNTASCKAATNAYGSVQVKTRSGAGFGASSCQGYNVSSAAASLNVGAYNAWLWPNNTPTASGNCFFPEQGKTWTPPTVVKTDVPLADAPGSYASGPVPDYPTRYRVFSSGIEVINTSSALNKQGALAVVRTSSSRDMEYNLVAIATPGGNVMTASGSPSVGFVSVPTTNFCRCRMPPATISEADTSGAVRWDASEGVYCVNTYDLSDLDFSIPSSIGYSSASGERVPGLPGAVSNATSNALISHVYGSILDDNSTTPNVYLPLGDSVAGSLQDHHFSPRDNICIYLTGLNALSTFTVTMKYFVEMAPTTANPTASALVPLLRPSPPMDQAALIAYQMSASRLLPGVPAHMNSFGTFFSNLFSNVIKPAVSTILPVAGPLLLKGAGALIGSLSHSEKASPPQKKKKQKPRPSSAATSRASSRTSNASRKTSKAVIIKVPKRSGSASSKRMQFPRSDATVGGKRR